MKKFLLIVVAAFAAANVSAANGVKKANFPKAQKAMVAPDAHLGILSKSLNAAMQAMSEQKAEMSAKTIQKAPDASELIPCYAEETGMYLPSFGFVDQFMYDGASYLVQDGKAYFAPFADLGMVEGVVEAGVQNMYSVLGADSITFTCSSIATLTATGEKLYLEPCNWVDYTAVRMDGAKTFGAYYFAEYGELYVPEILALFVEEPMEKNPISPSDVLYPLDLMPQSLYAEYTSKANASAVGGFDGTPYATNNAIAVFGEDCVYVKGAEMSFNPDAWMKFAMDENDESLYNVSALQGFTQITYKGDPGILVMVGAKHDGSSVTGFTGSSIMDSNVSFKWVDNADETSTLSILDNTAMGNYIIASTAEGVSGLGFFEAFANMTINITYESITGINEIKVNKQQSDAIYNIAGQRVAKDYKGLVIKNGKKYLVK
ncbi:MAG: hypothetical protein UHJ41_04030 [Bacteroidaceae bacterium]|nr:hypothetical protein [Bacteroidaceae bacterium]